MPDLPTISAPPTVIPEVVIPEKVFDRIWITDLHIVAPSPVESVSCRVTGKKFGIVNGVPELSTTDAPVSLAWDNLLFEASRDAELGGVVYQLLSYLAKQFDLHFNPVVVPEPEPEVVE